MPEFRVREGRMIIDGEKIRIVRTAEVSVFRFILYSVLDRLMGLDDEIPLKGVTIVSVEKGVPGVMCPHLHIHYGKKSRMVEFRVERGGAKPGCESEIDRAIDFLEKKKVPLGMQYGE